MKVMNSDRQPEVVNTIPIVERSSQPTHRYLVKTFLEKITSV